MNRSVTSATVDVPGAKLYYEVRGSGPLLLVIPGGPQDAGVFAELADALADRYTVVTFDPRGNSRSLVDGDPADLDVEQHADDAAHLIDALGVGPVHVLGTSGGGQVALSLAARHPVRVRTVVAHEPATLFALDDPSEAIARDQAVYDTYRRDGVDAAMGLFFGQNALEDGPDWDMPPEDMETFERVSGNFEYWLAHGLMPLSLYRPDLEALRTGEPRIVIGIGEESAGQTIAAIGTALAAKLGVTPHVFPGDHMGYGPHPEAFADSLRQALTGRAES